MAMDLRIVTFRRGRLCSGHLDVADHKSGLLGTRDENFFFKKIF